MSETHLKDYQAHNRARSVELVRSTMARIDAELEKDGYPHNGGKLSRREIWRRAGIGESTLKNPTRAATAELLSAWLQGKRSVPSSQSETARSGRAEQQILKLARELYLFKLQYEGLAAENETLRRELKRHSNQGGTRDSGPLHLKLVSE